MVWASAAERLPRYDFNLARSRQLLAEAGFPNGFSTIIYTNEGNAVRADLAEIMQNQLAQVGIRAEVRIIEWGAYLDMTARGEHTIFILGWVTVTGDPDYGLYSLFHSGTFGAPGNRTFYSNPEVDRLLDAGRMETDPARRLQIYYDVQRVIHRDVPWIFWHTGEIVTGVRADVRNVRLTPMEYYRMWEVYFE
jgi:peptide/nickel transport system substrate-binding protein